MNQIAKRATWVATGGALIASLVLATPGALAYPQDCFPSSASYASQKFDEVAPIGTEMRREGDQVRSYYASRGTFNSGAMIRDLIYVANDYGYDWDCQANGFLLVEAPTMSSTAPTTTSTTRPPTATTTTTRPSVTTTTTTTEPPTTTTVPVTSATTRPLVTAAAPPTTGSTASTTSTTPTSAAPPATGDPNLDLAAERRDAEGGSSLPWVPIGALAAIACCGVFVGGRLSRRPRRPRR